jgi:hypothetical protein
MDRSRTPNPGYYAPHILWSEGVTRHLKKICNNQAAIDDIMEAAATLQSGSGSSLNVLQGEANDMEPTER